MGAHPPRGQSLRRRAADRRAEARGLGLAELGRRRDRRGAADQAGAQQRHRRPARRPVQLPDEVPAHPAARRRSARADRGVHRQVRARRRAPSPRPSKPKSKTEVLAGRRARPPRAHMLRASASAAPLSIAQVTPHRRGTRNAGQRVRRRGLRRARAARARGAPARHRRAVKKRLATGEFDIVHVHEPFAPSVSSAALRHSYSLNVATFHAPQERVLSTQVARPLVEIFFGRIDARTVTSAATGELLERYFPAATSWSRGPDRTVTGRRSPTSSKRSTAGSRPAATTASGDAEARARIADRPLIEVDLHMHTDHSADCATPVEVLLRDGPRPRPRGDRDHRPQRGLGGARGAADRRRDGRHQGDRRRGGEDRRAGRGDRPLPRGEDPEGDDDGGDDRRDPRAGRPRLRAAPVRPLPLGARLRAPARHRRGDRHPRGLQPAGRR